MLLRNEHAILPLNPKELKKVAIVGPNAKAIVLSGGGSAALKASFYVNPYEGIVKALKESGSDIEIGYSEGARGSFSNFVSSIKTRLNYVTLSFKQPTRLCHLSTTKCLRLLANGAGSVHGTSIRAMTALYPSTKSWRNA